MLRPGGKKSSAQSTVQISLKFQAHSQLNPAGRADGCHLTERRRSNHRINAGRVVMVEQVEGPRGKSHLWRILAPARQDREIVSPAQIDIHVRGSGLGIAINALRTGVEE